MENKENKGKTVVKLLGLLKNKYALIVLAVGLVLILWPSGSTKTVENASELNAPVFLVTDEESRLQNQLCKIKGTGKVSVLLSVEGSAFRELAQSGEETLVLSSSGGEKVVDLYYVNPQYMGAVIVCEGASSAEVRLQITKAVSAFTGLSSDKITVLSMESKN